MDDHALEQVAVAGQGSFRLAPKVEGQSGVRSFPDREAKDVGVALSRSGISRPFRTRLAKRSSVTSVKRSSSGANSAVSRVDKRFARAAAASSARRVALGFGRGAHGQEQK